MNKLVLAGELLNEKVPQDPSFCSTKSCIAIY